MAEESFSGSESEKKHNYVKWIIGIVIVIVVLWYLNSQGYMEIPFF